MSTETHFGEIDTTVSGRSLTHDNRTLPCLLADHSKRVNMQPDRSDADPPSDLKPCRRQGRRRCQGAETCCNHPQGCYQTHLPDTRQGLSAAWASGAAHSSKPVGADGDVQRLDWGSTLLKVKRPQQRSRCTRLLGKDGRRQRSAGGDNRQGVPSLTENVITSRRPVTRVAVTYAIWFSKGYHSQACRRTPYAADPLTKVVARDAFYQVATQPG